MITLCALVRDPPTHTMMLAIVMHMTHSMITMVSLAPILILLASSIPMAFHAPIILKKLGTVVHPWDSTIQVILLVMACLLKDMMTAMMTTGIRQTPTIKTCAVMTGGTMGITIDGQTATDTY
ncbi:hypothetical protein EV424DRAFT_1545193 [Suillus variegatus]|nr:hypothetical protein EV424DRAFT_1545193 [Suillus variegatus]